MIFRKIILIILGLYLCTLLSAQTSRVDSLEQVLATFKGNNHEKGNLLIDISNEYRFADTAKCRIYIMEALNLTQRAGLDDVRKRAYMALGNYYRASGQFYLVHSNYKKAEKLCIQLNDREYLCRVYYNLMSVFLLIEDKENILYYIDKILETASEWYDLTTYTLLDSLKIPQTDQMPLWIFAAQYTKGWAMSNISTNKQELLDYYLDLFQNSMLNEENKIQIALECGRLLIEMNRHQEALYYLHLTREFYETYLNIYDILRTMSIGYALLAESYAVLNKMDSAKFYMEKAGEAPAMDHNTKIINYRARIAFESAKGNYENALEIHKEYFSFVDSISKAGKTEEIARMRNWYEFEQKDIKNELLLQEKQKQQSLILILTVAVFLFFAVLALIILFYRKTSEKNKELKKLHTEKDKLFSVISLQKDEIEMKNRDITDSINYAKRIQASFLPPANILETIVPESFIYYEPRDIVSGDFYWVTDIKGKFLCCCADCTGHGVPGALMSMIGATLLNDIVKRPEILSPADILNSLDFEIKNLMQKNSQEHSQDGMDIAVVEIDLQTYKIKIASAKRPVYLYSNDELTIYKGVRRSIGDIVSDNNAPPFVNIEYEGKPNDKIYLFSDGYADQFGGPYGKKLMIGAVKDILDEIHHKSMKEQFFIIKNNFINWKNNQEQVDDVSFIGIGL